jgi:hypothetical protein
MPSALEIRANFQDQSGEHMQIREITRRLNEGAFGAGFAQGAGISVPDIKDPSNALTAYGDARIKAAAAAAKPAIALAAKQEMQGWNTALNDLMKQKRVTSADRLDDSSKEALKRDLYNRIHQVLMQGKLGNDYVRELPAGVDTVSQPAATALVNQLNLAIKSILIWTEYPIVTPEEQLARWQYLSQSAYDAMALAQFYPRKAAAPMPTIENNPDGSYNIGDSTAGRLNSSDTTDNLIISKISAELTATPGRTPIIKQNKTDGSINIGSQRLDPSDPDEAKAIQRILSVTTGIAESKRQKPQLTRNNKK